MKRIVLFIYFLCIAIPCDISIRKNFFNDEIIGFYLSSIDLESGESSTLLFDYSIDLSACNAIDSSVGELFLDFDISMFVPSFKEENINLTNGKVLLYDIPLNLPEISFRNTDLNKDTRELSGGTKFSLEDAEINITDDEIKEISDLFLSQGKAPNGIYTFNFTLSPTQLGLNFSPVSISETVEVFVPSFLDLITPGSPEIADSLSNIVMMTNPIFQWNSDYCNKCDFFIRISEYRFNDHSSMDEALSDYSVLPLNGEYYSLPQNTNSFQYPNSGAGELYPGKIYVWQIKRSYMTSNGINEEFSPIYLFKVQSLDVSIDVSEDVNLENIKLFIGTDSYNMLFNEDGLLNGYNKVSPTINVNNQSLSINYLLELINKKNEGKITIIDVNVQ